MRYSKVLMVLGIILFSLQTVSGKIIQVPADSSTIQAGINGAVSGDTVLVAPGTYYEHLDYNCKGILVTSSAGAESTTIDKLYDGLPMVTFDSGEDSTSILDGFTIQNANNPEGNGGGITCHNYSSPIIRNNILRDNLAHEGAGIDVRNFSSPLIENNQIIGDSAASGGGGIACHDFSDPTITGNLFRENGAYWMGGGIFCRIDCSPMISQNLFIRNNAGNDGGAIYLRLRCSPTIVQNLMAKNVAGKAGAAIYCYAGSSPLIASNTIDGNNTLEWGGSITCHTGACPQVINNIFTNELTGYGIHAEANSFPTITYCDVWNNAGGDYSGCSPGVGCILADPRFCDPDNDDYYLWHFSPCVGVGDGGADIGGFGVYCCTDGSGDANGDGEITISDAVYLVNYLFRSGPPPNPMENGDVNCNGAVSIEDVILLINYLF